MSESDLADIHPLIASVHRAAEDAARQADALRTQLGKSPAALATVRTVLLPPLGKARDADVAPRPRAGAKADSLR